MSEGLGTDMARIYCASMKNDEALTEQILELVKNQNEY